MMLPAGSSGKPLLDLNLPPTEEPDPASTSDPQEGVEPGPIPLSEVERKTLARLVGYAPEARLLEEARAIIRLKGAITDRMFELDREAPDFWKKHRDAIIAESILTNRQKEYSSHKLTEMLNELTRSNAHASSTYRGIQS